jgi:hypothetical protein
MAIEDAYPADMPDHPTDRVPVLDPDTAERLLSGRLDPADAPPGYDQVAALLQMAAAPAHPHELAGEPAALAMFRSAHPGPAGIHAALPGDHGARPRARLARPRARLARPGAGRVRARLVALVLAGTLVTGGAAAGWLWTGSDVQPSGRLRSPTGGPGDGGSGTGVPAGVGPGASWELGSLTRPGTVRALGRGGRQGPRSMTGRPPATAAAPPPGAAVPRMAPGPSGRRSRRSPSPPSRSPLGPSPTDPTGPSRRRARGRAASRWAGSSPAARPGGGRSPARRCGAGGSRLGG